MEANFIIESGSEGSHEQLTSLGYPSPENLNPDEFSVPYHPIVDDDEGLGFFKHVNEEHLLFNPPKGPKIIGKYLFGESLGEGSYGKVKEVLDLDTLQRKAVKILKQRRLRKIPHGKENVEREIRMLKRLKHPNVIQMHDVMHCHERDKMYIVLEMCQSSLQNVLDVAPRKRLPAWQASKYFVQLIDGLEYLHGQGVIHKDIKPGNLLLSVDEILKITDFGVAEMLDKLAPNDLCTISQGSPIFQPPEIADGFNEFPGFKVDVWSAGATLFNVMTGKYPFEGDNVFLLFENIVKEDLQIPEECDDLLTDLLKGMLEKDSTKRLTVQQVKKHNWCRKRHPRSLDGVNIPRRSCDDVFFSMTTRPHLELLCQQQMGTGTSASPRDTRLSPRLARSSAPACDSVADPHSSAAAYGPAARQGSETTNARKSKKKHKTGSSNKKKNNCKQS